MAGARLSGDQSIQGVRVLVALSPESGDAHAFREVLARFAERVAVRYAVGAGFARALPEAEVVVAGGLSDDELRRAGRLRWLSSWVGGVGPAVSPALQARGIVLTSASGVSAPNIAEHLLTMILMFTRGMPQFHRAQLARRWATPFVSRSDGPGELTGQTLLIVGLGRIGQALAVRARPFGVRLAAVKHNPANRYNSMLAVDELGGLDALDDLLTRADHVCLTLPLTRDTHHLLDARRLSLMRPNAYLYNVSRGAVVDETALVAALRTRQIAGAGLDVFAEEPLPTDSPLWALDNVLLTPHVAGGTPLYFHRAAALFAENLDRFLAGQALENRFDPARGY